MSYTRMTLLEYSMAETELRIDYPEVCAMYGLDEAEPALEAMKL